MSWVTVGVAGTTAVLGAVNASSQAKAQKRAQGAQNMSAAAQTRYSPWTGMGPGQANYAATQDPGNAAMMGGLQGGLSGAMFAQQFGKGGGTPEVKPVSQPPMPGDTAPMPLNASQNLEMPQLGSSWGQVPRENTLYKKRG